MAKHIIFTLLLSGLLSSACWAGAVEQGTKRDAAPQLVDYEQQVREAAQRTADELKAKKAQERLDRAKTSSLNLVPSANTATPAHKAANNSAHRIATPSSASNSAPSSASTLVPNFAPIASSAPTTSSAPSAKPTAFTNIAQSSVADAGGLKVFKYRKGGTTTFSDSAPYKTHYEVVIYNSCYACSLTSSVNWHNTRLRLTEFADTINNNAKQYGVNPGFVRAIIHAESAFNPMARSRKGAMGLMQLMPGTASDMGVMDLTNPEQNIKGGVKYLAGLLQKFSGNETLAAAAYNAGPGAVTRYGGIPPFEETQTYVKRVKILADRYKNHMQLAKN